MKALLIYFSQTGNTRKIAERIAAGIQETGVICNLKSIGEVDPADTTRYELVGLGAPVFYHQEPFNVRDFVARLPPQEDRHWFVFCTHANVIGNFFPSLSTRLFARGARIIGYHNSYADLTYPFYPRHSYTSGHPDEIDLARAEQFGGQIILEHQRFDKQPEAPLPEPLPISSDEWMDTGRRITPERLKKVMPRLTFDAETCIQCHTCEKECPVQGIDVCADPPRLQQPCIFCWRCVNICPTVSITADWAPLAAMAPDNYARYKKELDLAASRGEFRWLVDPQSVTFDTPFYKQREQEIKRRTAAKNGGHS